MKNSEEVTIKFSLEEADYMWNTGMRSFYHSPEHEGRFLPMDGSVEDILDITSDSKTDEKSYMHWCDTYLEANILCKVLIANGFKAVQICDEASMDSNISAYVVLSDRVRN